MRDDPTVVSLVERARDGDHGAWDEIVRRYATLIWSVCRTYRLSDGDSADVAASVWLRLVERLGTLREPAALPGWIATTTRRECLQVLRAQQRLEPVEDDPVLLDNGVAPDDRLVSQERHIALRVAFAGLPARCRELLSMLFNDPPTPYAAIAEALGLTVGAIGPTRMRCLEKLRASPPVAALLDATPAGGAA